jgi:drug/metabolite transporter (DMT)-like permease
VPPEPPGTAGTSARAGCPVAASGDTASHLRSPVASSPPDAARFGAGRPEPLDAPFRGIAFVVAGVSAFAVHDVVVKSLSGRYPLLEIVFVRSLVALAPIGWLAWWERGPAALSMQRPWGLAARGLIGVCSFTAYYMALAALSLADTVALYFAAPLMLTTLSALVLRERVGARRWAAALVGFAGVLVVLRPGAGVFEWAGLLAVLSALLYAVSQTLTRWLGRTESAATIALSAIVVALLVSGGSGIVGLGGAARGPVHPSLAFLTRDWALPGWSDLGVMTFGGLVAAAGSYCLVQAYRAAPAGVVSPFEYIMIVWAVILGYVMWGSVPGGTTLAGVSLTVGAGLYLLRHEAAQERTRRMTRVAGEASR